MSFCADYLCCGVKMSARRVHRPTNLDDAFTSVYSNITKNHMILKLADMGMKDSTGWSLMHRAILNDDLDILKFLCDAGMNTGIIANDMTPVQLAIERGNLKALSMLLEAGCSQGILNNGCSSSFAPLLMAMMSRHECKLQMIELLLVSGCDVNKPDTYQGQVKLNTLPLCFAVRQRCYRLVEILLNHGAKILLSYNDECVSLFIDAILLSCKEIVELFIQYGADVNLPQKSSRTIHRWRLSDMTPLQAAILAQDISVMQVLLDHKANPNIGLKQRALHSFIQCHAPICLTAVKVGLCEHLKILLAANCALNWPAEGHRVASVQDHTSPLRFVRKNDKGLKLLLIFGCRPNSDEERNVFHQSLAIRIEDGTDFAQWLRAFWYNPQSLFHLSRLALRQCLGLDIEKKVVQLCLPRKVEDSILMKDELEREHL